MSTTYISMTFNFASNNTTLALPMPSGFTGTIDWGDGSSNTYINSVNPSNTYTSLGTYTVNLNDVTDLAALGSPSSSTVYKNSLTSFSYLSNIPSLTMLRLLFFGCTNNFSINFSPNVTDNVTDMSDMFNGASAFNQPITLDCSSCTDLGGFLLNASSFNSSVNLTNTSKVINMSNMFRQASSFNKPITLDCSSCTALNGFLLTAPSFNSSLSLTNTSKVTNMSSMFLNANSFNQPITLDCSSCTDLSSFLFNANSFNSSLNLTNTNNVSNLAFMFTNAYLFNQPITFNCSLCTNLNYFLNGASSFNSSLNLTNTSKITDMSYMFNGATAFNQPITLDCSSCTTLNSFLNNATSFNNILNLTPIPNLLDATDMIVNTNLSSTNYSNLLSLWGSQSVLQPNVTLTATGIQYNSSVQSYRTTLVSSPNNWNIIDGGMLPIPSPTITNFNIPAETYLGTSFIIVDPSSNSTGAFSYTSSDTSVARISGNTVQIIGIGGSTITATQAATNDYTSGDVSANLISNICFPAGTPITTDQGIIAIEKINPEIHTIRNKKIIGITKTRSTNDFLVCIEKHALGNNIPSQKTLITRDHQIFYNGKMRRAVELIEFSENIYKVKYNGEILYNVLMEQHDKMIVNNLICETLNPENPIAKLHMKIQKCRPEQQEKLIKEYNEFIIKNNNFSKKQLTRVL
jgi:hypothetical protein